MSVPHDVLPQKISIHLPWREKLCRRAGMKKFLHSFCEEIKIVHNSTNQRNILQPNNKNSHKASTHEKKFMQKKSCSTPSPQTYNGPSLRIYGFHYFSSHAFPSILEISSLCSNTSFSLFIIIFIWGINISLV